MHRKVLECKIKQLKVDLENETNQSAVWSKSQLSEQDFTSVQVSENLLMHYVTVS
jgi:hypothetical protein